MCTIDICDSMRALVEGVFAPHSSAIGAWQWQLWMGVQRVVGTYLDGGNGVGKIPPGCCRRRMLGGRKVVPNARILPCKSRSATTCKRGAGLGQGVRLHVGIYGVLNRLGIMVPSRSGVVGVHWWSRRWVSGITGVDRAGIRLGE